MSEIIMELTPELIHKYFEDYKLHIDSIMVFEEKLYSEKDRDKWIDNYIRRSHVIREAYERNNAVNEAINIYFNGDADLTDEIADALTAEFLSLDVGKYDDPFYAIHLAGKLLPFYEKKNNLSKMLLLLSRLGWEYMGAYRIGYKEYAHNAYKCYLNILSHRDKYATFMDPMVRRTFFVAYHNIICVMPSFSVINLEKAFRFYDEMMDFFSSEAVQAMDADNPEIERLIKQARKNILVFEKDISSCSSQTRDKFCEFARHIYREECERCGSEYGIPAQILLANYRALIMEHRCSYSEALEYLIAYYDIRRLNREKASGGNVPYTVKSEDFEFEDLFPDSMIFGWLKDPRVSHDMHDREVARMIKGKYDFFMRTSRTTYTAYLNQILNDWCFKSLNLLSSAQEKENALLNVVINHQIQTFFHSYMVADLACMITRAALKKDPYIFKKLYPNKNADEIRAMEPELLDYITKCSLFHDIGKTRITNVINMQSRKLLPEEIELIRKHPAIGADSLDEDFDEYHAVILGHHKCYDGKAGYPERYDSSSSKYKICLDIIAICDSCDAATDYLGRNYAPKKTFNDVMKELKESAGTKYNPFIVNLLEEDKELSASVDTLITSGREDKYFNLVKEHLQ